jgi:Amt family ammonium transporter
MASGGIDGNGIQVGLQFAEITAISAYSFTVSCLLLLIMKYIPGLHLRVSDEAEELGLDLDQFFDEEIGDWSIYHELEKKRYEDAAQTILGTREEHSFSVERVKETKAAVAGTESSS